MADKAVAVVYIGDGNYLPSVPAKDHETNEGNVKALLASGLYRLKAEAKKTQKKGDVEVNG